MKYLQVALNVPANQTFTYANVPAGKRVAQEEKAQNELIPQKRARKVDSFEAQVGCRAEVMFGNKKATGIITAVFDELPKDLGFDAKKIRKILRVLDESPLLTKELLDLGRWLSDFYLCPIGEVLCAMIPGAKKGGEAGIFSSVDADSFEGKNTLSPEQAQAVESIAGGVGAGGSAASEKPCLYHYLYGATGSGKTEVFLSAAQKVLERGQGVLYLVPEIGLTPQVVGAVTRRFGNTAAILHSALTPAQKLGEWKRIVQKEARVVIGARSAVFAPIPDLGLIIIDEEHDSSYKSSNSPRYHARQVAMRRASKLKIPLVMGSATPSVEAWKAMSEGQFAVHRLTKRLSGGRMPIIAAIDLSRQKIDGSISPALEDEIRRTLAEKRQAILFLNRRGFNHVFRCNSCGFESKCKNCSVPMTYHKAQNRLVCHYCSYSVEPFRVCPQCGSVDIGYSGFGTEFIESEVKSKFPNARSLRLDTDAVTKKGELEEKIAAFKKGEYDILLGTQMIAKGLNFPSLKLVGVILADTSLHLPDFRAAEKTFSLITQVAGRAGRFFPDGKVLVQTYSPNNPAVYCACHSLTKEFYEQELSTRKLLNFPPYSRLLRLVFRSMVQSDAEAFADDAYKILSQELEALQAKHLSYSKETEILGPSECPLSKINSNYRSQILLRGQSIALLQKLAASLIYGYRAKAGVYIEVDVDPVSLL
ncbi:MAG: primosomal protein N' [Treponema sp.]|nr:primosomal protein N' [Treponema sp.]